MLMSALYYVGGDETDLEDCFGRSNYIGCNMDFMLVIFILTVFPRTIRRYFTWG